MANGILKAPFYREITGNTNITSDASEGMVWQIKNTSGSTVTLTYDTSKTVSLYAGYSVIIYYINSAWTCSALFNVNGDVAIESRLVQMQIVLGTGTYNDQSVIGTNIIKCNTSSGVVTLNGLAGGVDGQIIHIYKNSPSNNLVINHNSGSATDEAILTYDSTNKTFSSLGGCTIIHDNGNWRMLGI